MLDASRGRLGAQSPQALPFERSRPFYFVSRVNSTACHAGCHEGFCLERVAFPVGIGARCIRTPVATTLTHVPGSAKVVETSRRWTLRSGRALGCRPPRHSPRMASSRALEMRSNTLASIPFAALNVTRKARWWCRRILAALRRGSLRSAPPWRRSSRPTRWEARLAGHVPWADWAQAAVAAARRRRRRWRRAARSSRRRLSRGCSRPARAPPHAAGKRKAALRARRSAQKCQSVQRAL